MCGRGNGERERERGEVVKIARVDGVLLSNAFFVPKVKLYRMDAWFRKMSLARKPPLVFCGAGSLPVFGLSGVCFRSCA